MTDTIFTDKKTTKATLKTIFNFQNKFNTFSILNISSKENLDNLIIWLKTLPINFVIVSDKDLVEGNICYTTKNIWDYLLGFDFALVDNNCEITHAYSQAWVVSLVPTNFYLSSVYKEFDPIWVVWNTFFYEENNIWSMFYSMVRYLENSKFTFDNKNLVKNVLKM